MPKWRFSALVNGLFTQFESGKTADHDILTGFGYQFGDQVLYILGRIFDVRLH